MTPTGVSSHAPLPEESTQRPALPERPQNRPLAVWEGFVCGWLERVILHAADPSRRFSPSPCLPAEILCRPFARGTSSVRRPRPWGASPALATPLFPLPPFYVLPCALAGPRRRVNTGCGHAGSAIHLPSEAHSVLPIAVPQSPALSLTPGRPGQRLLQESITVELLPRPEMKPLPSRRKRGQEITAAPAWGMYTRQQKACRTAPTHSLPPGASRGGGWHTALLLGSLDPIQPLCGQHRVQPRNGSQKPWTRSPNPTHLKAYPFQPVSYQASTPPSQETWA